MIQVEVSAPVNPTEEPEKVVVAISKLFFGIRLEKKFEQKPIFGKGPEKDFSLEKESEKNSSDPYSPSHSVFSLSGQGGINLLLSLHELIRREAIIDSFREKAFNKGLSEDGLSVRFLLNKQAAFVGVPSILEEEPLGSIEVIIKAASSEELKRLIEWLLPLTEAGKPIAELGIEYVEENK